MAEARLELRDLGVSRGGIPVLAGLTLTLEPGRALILRGPNGSGKTTLLRTLAGLQPPSAGSLAAGAEAIAYSSHADGVKSMQSVAENLEFWAQIYGTRGIDRALEAYRLHPLADRLAGTLSAGQRRRLGLARMVVTGLPIWAMDEPTVSLDRDAVALFAACVEDHLAGGGSAIIATHIDLGLARAETLDVSGYRVAAAALNSADEAFL